MKFRWIESILYGLVAGFTEFMPVSSQAHRMLLRLFLGAGEESTFFRFVIHAAALLAVIFARRGHWQRIKRERAILRIPKRRRSRSPNAQVLLEWKMLCNMTVVCFIGLVFYLRMQPFGNHLLFTSCGLLLNTAILAMPPRAASGNKDSRSMSLLDCIIIGIAGALSVLPGISAIGATASAAALRGLGRTYAVDLSLLLMIPLFALLCIFDLAAIVSAGIAGFSLALVPSAVHVFISTFIGAYFAVEILRRIAARSDMQQFAYYSFGVALFTFILYLVA